MNLLVAAAHFASNINMYNTLLFIEMNGDVRFVAAIHFFCVSRQRENKGLCLCCTIQNAEEIYAKELGCRVSLNASNISSFE